MQQELWQLHTRVNTASDCLDRASWRLDGMAGEMARMNGVLEHTTQGIDGLRETMQAVQQLLEAGQQQQEQQQYRHVQVQVPEQEWQVIGADEMQGAVHGWEQGVPGVEAEEVNGVEEQQLPLPPLPPPQGVVGRLDRMTGDMGRVAQTLAHTNLGIEALLHATAQIMGAQQHGEQGQGQQHEDQGEGQGQGHGEQGQGQGGAA